MKCYNLFPGGRHKALTLSYDDGVSSDIRMMEIMRRHGIKGTFNVNAGRMDGEGSPYRLRPEEYGVYEGFELAIHGYSHPFLNRMPLDLVIDEIVEDRRAIEKLAGYPVHGMAYPYGAYDDALIEQLRRLGVYYSRTTHSTFGFGLPAEFLAWHPTCHHNASNLNELCDKFLEESKYPGMDLFYLWGHTYEFERNNNWDVIESFCEKMGGRENIWYATNMEIYEYVQAMKRIDYSIDGSMVHNPSALAVWIEQNGEAICVNPGETKKL